MPAPTSTLVGQHQHAGTGSSADGALPLPVPRDARIVALILASMGVEDCDPGVVQQLLEFAHRYTHDVLSDALVYADHASSKPGSTNVSLDDVQLAIQSRVNNSFTQPPPKDFLLGLASKINVHPLPPIPDKYGVRLPPPEHCLTNINFAIVPNPPPSGKGLFDDEEDADADGEEVEVEPGDEGDEGNAAKANGNGAAVGEEEEDLADESMLDADDEDGTGRTGGANGDHDRVAGEKRKLEEDDDYD